MVEIKEPFVANSFLQKPSAGQRARVGVDVVRKIVRGTDMLNRGEEVGGEDDRAAMLVLEQHRLLSPGVAGCKEDVNAGQNLGHALLKRRSGKCVFVRMGIGKWPGRINELN